MSGPIIRLRDVRKVYEMPSGESLLALDSVSFDVQAQQFVCFLGPSGCGKSTLLNIIGGLDTATDGRIGIGQQASRDHGPDRRESIAFVFQDPRLLPWRTVASNIEFALDSKQIPRSEWGTIIRDVLGLVGLSAFAHYYPAQLSGGMQQRTSIARALAVKPTILLMDEPFSGLDEITARQLREELLNIWSRTKQTVIFVTHNAFEAAFLADRVLIFTTRPGRLHADITVPIERPRRFDDPAQFAFGVELVKQFLQLGGSVDDQQAGPALVANVPV